MIITCKKTTRTHAHTWPQQPTHLLSIGLPAANVLPGLLTLSSQWATRAQVTRRVLFEGVRGVSSRQSPVLDRVGRGQTIHGGECEWGFPSSHTKRHVTEPTDRWRMQNDYGKITGVYELHLPTWKEQILFWAGALLRWLESVENDLRQLRVKRSGQENRINDRGDSLQWPRDTLYPQKLALTSPTSGGRSVGIVRLRTKGHGV
jgi:hypothetical protein